jgi:hypothetical protein
MDGKHRTALLRRAADGQLCSATDKADIGDIWAEQKRIQLKETIDEQKRRVLKQQRRRERGLFGWRRIVTERRAGQTPSVDDAPQEVEIRLHLPSGRKLYRALTARIRHNRRASMVLVICVVLAAGGVASVTVFKGVVSDTGGVNQGDTGTTVLSAHAEQPKYDTLLPAGKTIKQLGGWGRVSPPDKDPVFAFTDNIDGVQLNVSQQPLPESFKKDIAGEVAKLATQFSATQQVKAGDTLVYVGTSHKGPQSAIFAKDDLLILIRSVTKLTDQQWATYVNDLQ